MGLEKSLHLERRRNGVKNLGNGPADPIIDDATTDDVEHTERCEALPSRNTGSSSSGASSPDEAGAGALPPPSTRSSTDLTAIEHALAAMGVGVFEYDPIEGMHRYSDRCKLILGLSVDDDPTPESIATLVHPEDRHLTLAACDSLRPDGPGHYTVEHRIIRPDGVVRWVRCCGRTVFQETPNGRRALRSHGTMLDVTERRIAERQLYERDSQLSTFIDGTPAPIAMFDREMGCLAVSRRFAEDLGASSSNLIGRRAYEVFQNQPEQWKVLHARCLEGASERCEFEVFVRPDGSSDWIQCDARPWYKADQTVGGFILFSELITQRVQAEQRLRASEAQLELAVRAGALGIYDYNLAERKTTWDARVRELWGVGPTEEVTFDTFIDGLHPDDRAATLADRERSLGEVGNGTHCAEYRIVDRRDGSERWVCSTGMTFYEGGHAIRMVGFIQDITARKKAELALAQSAAESRKAEQRKDAFLATLSHELRNPLAPIRTAAHILASPVLRPEQLAWARQVIQRQTTHMACLLDDLLDVARISRGKLVLKKDRVNFSSIVDSAVEATRPLLDEKHHRLLVCLPSSETLLDADPLRVSQVLSNLLANAAKYTDPRGQIELTARVEAATLRISVKDNGIGIPREALGQVFAMFWQLEGGAGRSEGGLGIGLAFVKGLVELHGGTIEARSAGPGRGSEFIVRLPTSLAPAVAKCPADSGRVSSTSHRVLVADDNKDAADSLAMQLQLANHDVRVAHSGRCALSLAEEFRPHIALLDIGMPELDGYAVARALRREPWATRIRLVALTGWGQEEDKQRASEAGFDHHLTKPVDPELLEQLLCSVSRREIA